MSRKTKAEIRNYLTDFIQQAGHQSKFFADPITLDKVVTAGPRMLDRWREWSTNTVDILGLDVASKYELEMLKLALYDIHVIIDDSASMKHERNMIYTMKTTSSVCVDLQNMFETSGIQLHYLNGEDPQRRFHKFNDFNVELDKIRFGGASRLGDTTRKVWMSIISNPSTFIKPCIFYIFTDGDPTGEDDADLIKSLRDCSVELERRGYTASAIAFTIVQVGLSTQERRFLHEIIGDPKLRDHVEVVMEDEAIETRFPDSRNPTKDEDFTVLRQFFGALNPKTLP